MIIYTNKRYGYAEHLIPVKDVGNIAWLTSLVHEQTQSEIGTWVYWCDGRPHRGFPTEIIPGLVDMFRRGRSITPEQIGYRPYWCVFEDLNSGEFSFGNKPSFMRSQSDEDRKRAESMMVINPDILSLF